MSLDTTHYTQLLEAEIGRINDELNLIAVKGDVNGGSFDPVQKESAQDTADREEVAENLDTYETSENVIRILETERSEAERALGRIKEGKYGICEACGSEIEKERLDANPSARTCEACMKTAE